MKPELMEYRPDFSFGTRLLIAIVHLAVAIVTFVYLRPLAPSESLLKLELLIVAIFCAHLGLVSLIFFNFGFLVGHYAFQLTVLIGLPLLLLIQWPYTPYTQVALVFIAMIANMAVWQWVMTYYRAPWPGWM